MRTPKIFLSTFLSILVVSCVILASCTPPTEPVKAKTKTELLTATAWRPDTTIVGNVRMVSPASPSQKIKFNADGTGASTTDGTSLPTVWSFQNAEQTTLRFGVTNLPVSQHTTFTIDELTEKRMRLSITTGAVVLAVIYSPAQ